MNTTITVTEKEYTEGCLEDCDEAFCERCCDAECGDCDDFFEFAEYAASNFVELWNAKYSGVFVTSEGHLVKLEKALYQKPSVILFWDDGTKSTARCAAEDTYSIEMGLLIAAVEKTWGKKNVDAFLKDWSPLSYSDNVDVDHNKYIVTMADVRRRHRPEEKAEKQKEKELIAQSARTYLESCGYTVTKN